ncbi:peptidase-like protein [Xylariales sp. AK1849]|nr:peptidase-like protein [Xylariales sp. AK1849]
MRRSALVSAALLLLKSTAQPVASNNVVLESLYDVPAGWRKLREADPTQTIQLRIALEQPNVSNGKFGQTLYDISTPQHALYRQHLSREEVRDLVKPRKESTDAVISWLKSAGIPGADIEDAGEWVIFRTMVGKAETLLDADFAVYNHVGTQAEKLRTLEYSVPETLKSHITMIQPTTVFGGMRRHDSHVFKVEESPFSTNAAADDASNVTALCSLVTNPACLRALYNIGNYTADPSVGTIVGVSGFLEEYAKHDALDTFLARFATYAITQNFTTTLINGGADNQTDTTDDDVEANLDMQYVAALAFNQDIQFYSTGGRGPLVPDLDQPDASEDSDEPYLEAVTYLLNLTDDELPTTLTTSYGDNEREIPLAYAQKVCDLYGQLGARGVSVLFSSGDSGPGSACQTNDGSETTRFTPSFPGACPYITSVGGTTGVEPERAVSFSSGGFSDYFPRPSYQDAAVPAYLAKIGDTFTGLYNESGRGFPDVSAQGNGFQVVSQGRVISVGGTSASAPTFASIVSLLNNALVAQGKAPLGFLNPWLYSTALNGSALTDITAGGSKGCTSRSIYSGEVTPVVAGAGWNATEGWDPVTGLGTPLFDKLLELATAA